MWTYKSISTVLLMPRVVTPRDANTTSFERLFPFVALKLINQKCFLFLFFSFFPSSYHSACLKSLVCVCAHNLNLLIFGAFAVKFIQVHFTSASLYKFSRLFPGGAMTSLPTPRWDLTPGTSAVPFIFFVLIECYWSIANLFIAPVVHRGSQWKRKHECCERLYKQSEPWPLSLGEGRCRAVRSPLRRSREMVLDALAVCCVTLQGGLRVH